MWSPASLPSFLSAAASSPYLLTSLPTDLECGLGFPVTKVAIQGTFRPCRALLLEAFSLQEAVITFPIPSEERGLCNLILCPLALRSNGVSVALRIRFRLLAWHSRPVIMLSWAVSFASPFSLSSLMFVFFKQKSSMGFWFTHHRISRACHRPGAQ